MSNTDGSLQMILDAILSEYANVGEEITDSAVSGEVGEVTSKSAVILLDKLKLESGSKLGASRGIEGEFEAAVLRTWRKPLELLDLLLYISLEVGSEFNSGKMSDSSKRSYVKVVLAGQQANACLVFNEIVHLLKSGFPSGAHSRWRRLHEIACVSYFVSKHGEDMARRFIDYEAVEGYYQAQAILDHQREMYCEILSEDDFKVLKREFSKVKNRYGSDFVSKAVYPYGWVPREVLKTRSLREIEKAVKLDVLRPYYDVASYNVLGGPKGLMFKMGTVKKGKRAVAPVGPSNYGLADPGKSAAISLGQVMACVLQAESTFKRAVIVEALRILVDEICDAFCEIQAEFGRE
jgi:hypothetical protein